MTMTDSIIDEVRHIREQHAASLGYDLDRIFADLQMRQNRHESEGWGRSFQHRSARHPRPT
jgi:hypothetical protein